MSTLNVPQVTQSLQRVLVFFFPEPREQIIYIQAIHEAVGDLCESDIFDRACQIVAKEMIQGKKPVPSDYLSAIRGILQISKKHHKCEKCGGIRMVDGEVWSELYGKRVSGMILCSACRGDGAASARNSDDAKKA